MQYPYIILDVFTQNRFEGNPLAVVEDADNLSDAQMQRIATEFNLSETVFICQPESADAHAKLRIFTPKEELPFAGHPTVGAAVFLGQKHALNQFKLEENVGSIDIRFETNNYARFKLPRLPQFVEAAPDSQHLAQALGIRADEIGYPNMQPAIYSAGVPFVLAPVQNADILKKAVPNLSVWDDIFNGVSRQAYVYTPFKDNPNAQFTARSFVDLGGIAEDAATGSAVAALCGQLATPDAMQDGFHKLTILQGADMGRPSYIDIEMTKRAGKLVDAEIGGHGVIFAKGALRAT